MLDAYLKLLEQDYFEVGEAFKGLADENVWKRPAPGLLSVGELAGHVAYWQAVRPAGEGEDMAKCKVTSPLIDPRFRYYQTTIATPPSDKHLAMTAEQVHSEVVRVHAESLAHFKALNPDLDSVSPGPPFNFTYGTSLEYLVFHIAYHTGQIYTSRHLLGEETPDN
jgi:hypothetical protein